MVVATTKVKPDMPHDNRVVLVTGAAGFIGFHVSKQLVGEEDISQVVGLDSFNAYYDVQLKKDRASHLFNMGVKVCVRTDGTWCIYPGNRFIEAMCVIPNSSTTSSLSTTSQM
jgi:hypothetical protein